jgi:phenylacetate-CoA ligase
MQNINLELQAINELVKSLHTSQYAPYIPHPIPYGPITTKYDLQNIKINPDIPTSRTSGTTGTPLIIPKTQKSIIWHKATNIRELQWRKWDFTKKCVVILARIKNDNIDRNIYNKKLDTNKNLQIYLEQIQPSYLYTYPSIIRELDLSKLHNLIDVKSVGEVGGTNYSCEEAGTIALQCPEFNNYHIMENIIVESDKEHGILITDLTNPIINRYALGDMIELGTEPCKCGRTLPTITKIYGRVRNMLLLPDNNKIWPTVGEPLFRTITDKIIRHQTIQRTLNDIELRLQVKEVLTKDEYDNLISLVLKSLGYDHLNCNIVYVDKFEDGKFEAFKCDLKN